MANEHAVVLGAGVGGLLAARVLSERFARVTVIERDALPPGPGGRRGVPQGRHVHGFQARGVQILEELFPGLVDELVAAGASRIDDLANLHFRVGGHLLSQASHPMAPVLLATPPFLEYSLRMRVAAARPVMFRDRLEVATLTHTRRADGSATITGVCAVPPGGGAVDKIAADLVVDTTGRGSRTPVWLGELGYERPVEERIAVRVKYASEPLRLAGATPKRFLIEGRAPQRDLGVALFGCEHDRWTFTVLGAERAFESATPEWMRGIASSMLPPWAMEILRTAEPLGPVATHRHPASVRRRYDRLSRFPDGLVVLGDALCAFNPIYGQGISVAAEQAIALRDVLVAGLPGLARRLFRAAAAPTAAAWDLAAGSDLGYPEVEGDPTLQMRLSSRYVERVLMAAESDPEIARRFMAVAGLVSPPTALFSPRVLARGLGRRPGRARTYQGPASAVDHAAAQLPRHEREDGVAHGRVLLDRHAAQIE
jgi:2-polyprenyl-6-methoxyphenol hydroxylase-like FAD-dependent oxidoreductase